MFLTIGEKILKLRKQYGVTQTDLASHGFSRTSLGMIEIGKRTLTLKLAEKMVEKFNEILAERGAEDRLSVAELLKDKNTQAKEWLDELISSGKDITSYVWEIDEALVCLDAGMKAKYYKSIGEIFDRYNNVETYERYISQFLHYAEPSPELESYIKKIINIYETNDRYKEILLIYQEFKNVISDVDIYLAYVRGIFARDGILAAKAILETHLTRSRKNTNKFVYEKQLCELYYKSGDIGNAVESYAALARREDNFTRTKIYCIILNILKESKNINIDGTNIDKIKKYFAKAKSTCENMGEIPVAEEFYINHTFAHTAKILGRMNEAKKYYLESHSIIERANLPREQYIRFIGEIIPVLDSTDFQLVATLESKYKELVGETSTDTVILEILEWYRNHMSIQYQVKLEEYKNSAIDNI